MAAKQSNRATHARTSGTGNGAQMTGETGDGTPAGTLRGKVLRGADGPVQRAGGGMVLGAIVTQVTGGKSRMVQSPGVSTNRKREGRKPRDENRRPQRRQRMNRIGIRIMSTR